MEFAEVLNQYCWQNIEERIYSSSQKDVEHALSKQGRLDLFDLMALLSPAAGANLEQMACRSQALTKKRFGNTMQLYVPMYLSNECQNICTYCGFSLSNKIPRLTLSAQQIIQEVAAVKAMGFEHILLVSGEASKSVGLEYFRSALSIVRPAFSNVAMEVQPLEQQEYEELIRCGLDTVLVYQETYNRELYREYHPKGKKSKFDYRLQTPERLGKAGIYKIGLGVLLGLADWRTDSWFTALHLNFLERHFWKTRYSISFPRLRPAVGVAAPKFNISDRELVQLICAYRIFNENVELSLSTRESKSFRDNAIRLGVTSISAGSKTEPGGYALKSRALEQFEIDDNRSPQEVAGMLRAAGYEPVWKDWDRAIRGQVLDGQT